MYNPINKSHGLGVRLKMLRRKSEVEHNSGKNEEEV